MSREDEDRARVRAARRLLRRLEARTRLEQLAGAAAEVLVEQRELERLKYHYLPMWSAWCFLTRTTQGLPSQVPFTDYMKGSMREFDETSDELRIDGDTCRVIDQAVDELTGRGVVHARAVLAVRYLNAAGAAVYRSGRVTDIEPDQVDDLCDQAERALVPIVKRRGLLL